MGDGGLLCGGPYSAILGVTGMIAPTAEFIEEGQALLETTLDAIRQTQRRELNEWSVVSEDFRKGYELGLSTARAVNAQTQGKLL